jgi:hypothetical protein
MLNLFLLKNLFILTTLISTILCLLPYIGAIASLFNTFIHEFGHALATLLTSGQVVKMKLQVDSSGSLESKQSSKIKQFITALSGYVFSSVYVLLSIQLLLHKQYNFVILLYSILLAISLLLWIRNLFGAVFSLITISTFGYLFYLNHFKLNFIVSVFLTALILADSVLSTITLVKLSIIDSKKAGDATSLASITFIPALIWALLFMSISLIAAFYTFQFIV